MDDLDEVIAEFLVESHEGLDALDQSLVALERDPDPDEIGRVFRAIHTIKGTSGCLGFATLERLTHAGEGLLSQLRDGARPVTTETTSALLAMVDAVRDLLDAVARTGADDGDVEELVLRLAALHDAGPDRAPAPSVPRIGELLVASGAASLADIAEALTLQAGGDTRPLGEVLVATGAITPAALAEALQAQAAAGVAGETMRVEVGVLDALDDLVGELVDARDHLLKLVAASADDGLQAGVERLDVVTARLQEAARRTRTQPIRHVLDRFARVVRDVALACGKDVRLQLEADDTPVDRTVLEAIKDPLTHLVRNAVDHGIEAPAVRRAAGKPAQGRLLVRALHEDGHLHLEIADDGAGIDVEQVRRTAVAAGLTTAATAAVLSDREVLDLVFRPGFTTAREVTNLSGRGVGMDVVRTNVERVGGTVAVTSSPGAGTSLRIRIPLSR